MSNTYDLAWITTLCDVWSKVPDGGFGTIKKSYNLVASLDVPDKLSDFPCAITYPPMLDNPLYSLGDTTHLTWRGMTVFHLTANLAKANMPIIFPYMIRILDTAMNNARLGTTNGSIFKIAQLPGALSPMENLQFGGEEPHYGVLVQWVFEEHLTHDVISVSY